MDATIMTAIYSCLWRKRITTVLTSTLLVLLLGLTATRQGRYFLTHEGPRVHTTCLAHHCFTIARQMLQFEIYISGHLIRYPILILKHSPSHLIHMSHFTSSHFSLYHTHTTIITHLLSHLILLNTIHLN